MTRTAGVFAIVLLLTCSAALAESSWDWDDIFEPYRQRSDRMTSSSGNGQNVNTATHAVTFWPRHVRDRRIPADGARMTGAIQRYHDGGKQRLPLMVKPEKESFEMDIEKLPSGKTGVSTSGQK